jgi:hypothetical protein
MTQVKRDLHREIGKGVMAKSLVLATIMLAWLASAARAMEVRQIGDQLILDGAVVGDEYDKVARALATHPAVLTIILRNSSGGHIATGYRLGELFRTRGLRTAVSGICYSSCSRMFLGGKERNFTNDFPAADTHVGFHGHYDKGGNLIASLVRQFELKAWIIRYSDGKADEQLVERWINIPRNVGMIHFYHPELVRRNGMISTFMCQGDENPSRGIFGCEPIAKTAIDVGVVTSLALVHSNDQDAVRSTLLSRPPQSGFAAIDDDTKVPLSPNGIAEYRRFLATWPPRAFAIAPDKRTWGWVAGPVDAMRRALERCAMRAGHDCRLYAVDDEVVWTPSP